MRGQRGQASVEYVAIVALAAAVLGAAGPAVVVAGLGERVVEEMRRALCVVTGGSCDDGACVIASRRETSSGEVDVGVARLGGEETLLREERADGTVALTLVRAGARGVQLGVGADARIGLGGGELIVGGEARVALLARAGAGETYVVSGQRAADELERRLRLSVLARRPETTIDNPVGGLPDMSRPTPRLPVPDQTFHEHGAAISLDAATRLGLVKGALRLEGDEVAGERVDARSGHRTVYLRRTGGASGSLTVLSIGGAGAGWGRELYAVTVDRDGRPLDLQVVGAMQLAAGARVPGVARDLARGAGVPVGESRLLEVERHLDLRDAESLAVATAFLERLVGSGDDRDGAAAALGLRRRLDAAGTGQARLYETSETGRGVGGHVAGGLRLGASFGGQVVMTRLVAGCGA